MFKKIFTRKKLAGFSLLEMMAVIAIVAIGLVGTTQLVVQSLQAQRINRSTIIAYQLSQEGAELVRYRRDTNWLKAESEWDAGIKPGTYCIDYINPILRPVNTTEAEACQLYQDANDWYYHPTTVSASDTKTNFRRLVEIVPIADSSDYLKARIISSWEENGRVNRYVLESELYNWY